MKRFLIALSALALMLTGCSKAETKNNDVLKVCTSFYAIYDLTAKVAGDKAQVVNLVPTGTEPHDWEPSTHDMVKIDDSDLVLYNGLGMEGWIDSVKEALGDEEDFVELSEGLADTAAEDPHIWLDPEIAAEMTMKIADAMAKEDEENADYYKENAKALCDSLAQLDSDYKTRLEPYKGGAIVVSHEAYSYMCKKYGIEQISVEGVIPNSEPSPEQMKNIIDYINENGIKYIFFEELLSPKVVNTIAEATGAQLLELNPFEGLEQEAVDAGEDYISVMYENLDNLETALKNTME